MEVEVPPRDINQRDPRATLQAIMRRWLPLSEAILRMVVRTVQSPSKAQMERISTLLPDSGSRSPSDDAKAVTAPDIIGNHSLIVRQSVAECRSAPDSPVVVFVAKMTSIRVAELSARDLEMLSAREKVLKMETDNGAGSTSGSSDFLSDSSGEVFMALGRVFSGVLTRESRLYVLGHRHNPFLGSQEGTTSGDTVGLDVHGAPPASLPTVSCLEPGTFGMYMCFGPSVVPVDRVPAGNIVGIVGIHDSVLKTGTLASTWACFPMKAITFQAKPVVRVAVEPLSHKDLSRLELGLQSLYQFDPAVEVGVDESGQHTVTCIGELHLEQCLKSLTERFARYLSALQMRYLFIPLMFLFPLLCYRTGVA